MFSELEALKSFASNRTHSSTDGVAVSASPWRRQSDSTGAYLPAPHSFRPADSALIFIMNNIVSIHHGVRWLYNFHKENDER